MALESSVSLTDWSISYPVSKADNEVYHPAKRPLVYTATYSGGLDIRRAKVRIIVDGTTVNSGAELIVDPDLGGTTVFTFDINETVKNYVSSLQPTLGSDMTSIEDTVNTADVRISIADVSLVASVLTTGTYRDMGSGEVITVFNGGYDDSQIHRGTWVDTDNDGVLKIGYMTLTPKKQRLRLTDDWFIGMFGRSDKTSVNVDIQTYINSATENSSTVVAFSDIGGLDDAFYVGVGPANVEAEDPTLITDSTTHYTATIKYGTGTQAQVTVVIDKNCSDSYTMIAFLNRFGFMDYCLMRGEKIRKIDSKHKYIKKPRDLARTSDISDRLAINTGVDYSVNYKVSTGMVKEDQALWLEELLTSPEVFVIEDGNYFPVEMIKQKATTEDKTKGIYQVGIEYRYVQANR